MSITSFLNINEFCTLERNCIYLMNMTSVTKLLDDIAVTLPYSATPVYTDVRTVVHPLLCLQWLPLPGGKGHHGSLPTNITQIIRERIEQVIK
jgi:hypothetical protein